MPKSLEKDFTQGNVVGLLLRFCVPFLLANLLQALYGMVDVWVVGRFCPTDALAGVNSASQVTHLVTMAVSGLSVGGTVLVAQYFAARKPADVSETIGTMFSLLFLCACALTAVVLAFTRPILARMNLEGEALRAGADYLRVCAYGTAFIFGYNAISSVQRGLGDATRPLWFVGAACAVNIALDWLFVGPMGMGAKGAALATVIAQALSFALAAAYLSRRGFAFDFKPKSFRIRAKKARLLITLGLPSSAQSIITNVSFILMTALSNGMSVTAGAAVGVVGKLNSMAILPIIAISSAIRAVAAQNIAAQKFDRAALAARAGTEVSLAVGLITFFISQIWAEPLIRIFKSDDAGVVRLGAEYLRANGLDYIGVAFLFCMNGLIMSSGHAAFSMVNSCVSALFLRIPAAYLLSKTALGIAGIGYAAPAATLAAVVMAAVFLKKGKWRDNTTGIRREST